MPLDTDPVQEYTVSASYTRCRAEYLMEQQTNFTCRVDADLKRAFLRAAKANDRPASVLIRDFMRGYVQHSMELQQGTLALEEPAGNQRSASW